MSDLFLPGYQVAAGGDLPGAVSGLKASRTTTGGSLTVIEQTLDGGPPRHTHRYEDESFYVLDGQLDVACGADRFAAPVGSFVFLPRRVPHVFSSVDGPARVLIIATPGGLEEYFAELRTAHEAGADPDELARIRRRHGILGS